MELVFGTRGSKLALAQTESVIRLLTSVVPELNVEVKVVKTLGDRKQENQGRDLKDKQDWVEGLDAALVNKEIDLAIHSAKDVPVDIHPASTVLPIGLRKNFQDLFIPHKGSKLTLQRLPEAARIGTASLRRQAQLMHFRSDLQVVNLQGNINTRIDKLNQSSELSGILLAAAGLERLEIDQSDFQPLPIELILPAVNQGTLLGHFMSEREDIQELLELVLDPDVNAATIAERHCIELLEANCHSAIGVLAQVSSESLSLHCRVLLPDGSEMIESRLEGAQHEPKALSEKVAEDLILKGASRILIESDKIA